MQNLKLQFKIFLFLLVTGYWLLVTSSFAQDIKEPSVAGTFYPANPKDLSKQINDFLDRAETKELKSQLLGLISPHAGYVYSGGVAAYGYKLLKDKQFDTIIIIGPSHFVDFQGISVWAKGKFKTPLGDVSVDEELAQEIINYDKDSIKFYSAGFSREHSVEVQLPFLQEVLKDFKIVPILISRPTIDNAKILANAIQKTCKNKQVLIVASTDMSHYHNYKTAVAMDKLTLKYLSDLDAQGLHDSSMRGKSELCGLGSVLTILLFAKENNLKLEVLKYANSGDVTFELDRVVGYTSCALYKNTDQMKTQFTEQGERKLLSEFDPPPLLNRKNSIKVVGGSIRTHHLCSLRSISDVLIEKGEDMLNELQKKRLLEIARRSLEDYIVFRKRTTFTEDDPVLTKEQGAFVTLTYKGELRGCIGHIVGDNPLYKTIADMAIEAGTGDPRFPAVTAKELKDIEIEISVLSPLERIADVEKIEVGKHGILLRKGFNSGLLLPQVATEYGWDRNTFLEHTCLKADLSSDDWRDSSTQIYIFSAIVFSEKEHKR